MGRMKKAETLYKVRENASYFEVAQQLPFQTPLPSSVDLIQMVRVGFPLPVFSHQKGALKVRHRGTFCGQWREEDTFKGAFC